MNIPHQELRTLTLNYSAVQINVVEDCVSAVLVHATFDYVYLDSTVKTGDKTDTE